MADNENEVEPPPAEDAGEGEDGEGEESEEDDDKKYEKLGEEDDTDEQKRKYKEYLKLVEVIGEQNKTVEEIKTRLMALCGKKNKTASDNNRIKCLRECMEQESLKIRCMINKAMALQNFGSNRKWGDVQLATSFDEDNIAPYVCLPKGREFVDETEDEDACGTSCNEDAEEQEAMRDHEIKCLCKALGKMNICNPEDKQLVKEISSAVLGESESPSPKESACTSDSASEKPSSSKPQKKEKKCPPPPKKCCCPPPPKKSDTSQSKKSCPPPDPCACQCPPPGPRCSAGKTSCNAQKKKPQSTSGGIDAAALKKKICAMQMSLNKMKDQSEGEEETPNVDVGALRKKICSMQCSINKLKEEMCKREQANKQSSPPANRQASAPAEKPFKMPRDPTDICLAGPNKKSAELEKLKDNYLYLLSEYAKKDCKLKELEKRIKGYCGGCGGGAPGRNAAGESAGGGGELENAEESELELLRARLSDLKEEQVEFRCIMTEQAQQLEDYRTKYLAAQQKVEEQSVTLDKLNMNNKRIEKQINNEIKEIRNKFQEKLNELLQYPKLLENEQLKLAAACKEKTELQNKLTLVCKELKMLKGAANPQGENENTNLKPQLDQCKLELMKAKEKVEELQRQADMYCEELKNTKADLDVLRCESAKIIARTKERSEQTKQRMQDKINSYEKELAQCRATACLSVSDREAVIREMQGQLNTLSYSFDTAQKQIKTLKNHIAYVSNENCFPMKC